MYIGKNTEAVQFNGTTEAMQFNGTKGTLKTAHNVNVVLFMRSLRELVTSI